MLGDVRSLCTGHLFGTFSMSFLFGGIEIEPVISNMLGECSIAELYGPALYCVI